MPGAEGGTGQDENAMSLALKELQSGHRLSCILFMFLLIVLEREEGRKRSKRQRKRAAWIGCLLQALLPALPLGMEPI